MVWLRSTTEEGREERQPAWLWCERPYKAVRRGNYQRGTDVSAENLSHSTTSLGNWCTSKWNSSDSFSIITAFCFFKNPVEFTQLKFKIHLLNLDFILLQKHLQYILLVLNYPSTIDTAASTCLFFIYCVRLLLYVCVSLHITEGGKSLILYLATSLHIICDFTSITAPQGHWLILCNVHSERTVIIITKNKVSIHLMFLTLASHHRLLGNE